MLFLLEVGNFLQQQNGVGRDSTPLLKISEEILSLVVEAMMRRDYLVNSGTSLVWKVCSIGIISEPLAMFGALTHVS